MSAASRPLSPSPSSPTMPAGSELAIHTPDGQTRMVPLTGNRIGLGRASTNELCYPEDSGLSRQHLAFELSGGNWTVRDLGSKNGTQVNAMRLTEACILHAGDQVTAGHLLIEFRTSEPRANIINQTVCFVPEVPSAASNTFAVDLEAVLSKSASPATTTLNTAKAVHALIRAGQELSSHRPLNELFRVILDLTIEAVGASRGVVMTYDGESLEERASHGNNFQISTTIRDRVLLEKKSLLIHDAQLDADLASKHSVILQGMRSLMAVPLQTRDRVIGLVYVDMQNLVRTFTEDDVNLLTVMANVAAIRIEHARLAEIEEAERMLARELNQAAEIQRGLLPSEAPAVPGVDVFGYNIPCRTVGGDYFDYFVYPDGRIGLVVADVSGKGMPAALMMSNVQAYMRVLAESGASAAEVVTRLNRAVAGRCPDNRFITFFYAVIDPKSGHVSYCNAGHNPPVLVHANGTTESLEVGGMILGIFGMARFQEGTTQMAPGDVLAMYSDGITEACRPSTEDEFGEDRFGQLISSRRNQPSHEIVNAVFAELTNWTSGGAFADDATVVVARRTIQ